MAICSRCGRQTESAGARCHSCSMYGPVTSSVGASSAWASRASHSAATALGGPRPGRYSAARLYARADRYWPAEPDHYSLAHANRRRLDEETAPETPALPQLERAYTDIVPSEPGSVPPSGGRRIALVVAAAVLLLAAAATEILVVAHGWANRKSPVAEPSVTVTPSVSERASIARAGQNQLSVARGAATAPHEAAIVASLNRYFDAINTHNYRVYKRQFIPALRGGLSAASFDAEFGTARYSAEQLSSIDVTGAGRVDAFVTFTSHQSAGGRPADTTCTAWNVEYYLVPRGHRYLLAAPPLWYEASDRRCS
jgi:hypothetical protein